MKNLKNHTYYYGQNVTPQDLNELTKRLIINEIKLEKIIEEQKFKKKVVTKLKNDLLDFACITAGIVLGLLIFTKLHF